jgi:hypothetical protein
MRALNAGRPPLNDGGIGCRLRGNGMLKRLAS